MRQKVLSIVEKYLGRGHFSGEENVSVRCPFHKGGQETRPSFSINVTNGVWHCFTCKASGPLGKLLRALNLPRNVIDAELHDIKDELKNNEQRQEWKRKIQWVSRDPFLADPILPEIIIKPFEYCPMSLVEAGFDPAWLQWMDVGFDKENNRIIYPVRDIYGNLAGVSGGATIAGQFPKYKVYQGQRNNPETNQTIGSDYGPWFDEIYPNYTFKNHRYLWNFDQVYPLIFFSEQEQTIIIVEGFKACLWLLQHGHSNTVALMGSSMSDHQRTLLHRLRTNVILFLDNDEAGIAGTSKIASDLIKIQPGVRIALYPNANECQPDDLTAVEITAAIQGAETYSQWKGRTNYVDGRSTKRRTGNQQ